MIRRQAVSLYVASLALCLAGGLLVGHFASRDRGLVNLDKVAAESAGGPGSWSDRLPAEQWVELQVAGDGLPPYRWTHSGAVYAPSRNSLVLFGADSHLVSFDNAVYELSLADLRGFRHQLPAPPWSMRTDGAGRRIAGIQQLQPWPMHVYDAMLYDPRRDQVRVLSGAKHSFRPAPGAQEDPGWVYDLATRRWAMAPPLAGGLPNFFATGAAYDSGRDTVMAYASLADAQPFIPLAAEDETPRIGVWELGPDRAGWRLATEETHHWGWFNAEFDAAHGVLLVFGGSRDSDSIWAYTPGAVPGQAGTWEERVPGGDDCPGGFYFPAAYDDKRGVTLALPPARDSDRSLTCVYDYGRNEWRNLTTATLPRTGLNYTLVYAAQLDVFVLVGGSFFEGEPTRVWALRPGPARVD